MIPAIASVIRGEGLPSAFRRAGERVADALRDRTLRACGALVRTEPAAILNVSAAPLFARFGGVQVQLIERLRAERTLRNVALLHPGGLEVSAPILHARAAGPDFASSVRRALELTGARTIHLEGTSDVPIDFILRLAESGVRVVVSVHDFSLFCARPHLLELPAARFCSYSRDLDRCERCLRATWNVTRDDQSERRARGRELLAAATGLIFPSRFLLERHRDLFSLPLAHAAVIEPGVPPFVPAPRHDRARTAVAYAGSVKRHKGAHLLPDLVRGDVEWHVFGGGDEDLLRAIRRAPNVTVHGYYRHGRLPSLLARHRIGLVVLPSIVPETHSLVLSEAWLAGATAATFDLGAPAERIRTEGGGHLTPLESGVDGLSTLVERWSMGNLLATPPHTVPSPLDAARACIEQYGVWGVG